MAVKGKEKQGRNGNGTENAETSFLSPPENTGHFVPIDSIIGTSNNPDDFPDSTEHEFEVPDEFIEVDESEIDLLGDSMIDDYRAKQKLDDLMFQFPSTSGFYGKLYHKDHVGTWNFIYKVDRPEEMSDDAESYIHGLIRTKGWEAKGNEWRLDIHRKGKNRWVKKIDLNYSFDIPAQAPSSNSNPAEMLKLALDGLKEQAAGNVQQKDPLEAMERSIKLFKEMSPQQSDQANQMLEMIKYMQESRKSETKVSEIISALSPILAPVLAKMFEKPAPPPPAPDPFESLIKFKQLFPDPLPPQDNTFKTLEMIATIKDLFANGENASVGTELVRHLGPQLSDLVGHITGGARDIAKAVRSKNELVLAHARGQLPSGRMPKQIEQQPLGQEAVIQQEGAPQGMTKLDEINNAIQTQDVSYYPELEQVINLYVSGAIAGMLDGSITVDYFLSEVSKYFAGFGTPEAKVYMEGFIAWKREQLQAQTAPDNNQQQTAEIQPEVTATCEKCGETYDFEVAEHWEADSKICGKDLSDGKQCDGKLKRSDNSETEDSQSEPVAEQDSTGDKPEDAQQEQDAPQEQAEPVGKEQGVS